MTGTFAIDLAPWADGREDVGCEKRSGDNGAAEQRYWDGVRDGAWNMSCVANAVTCLCFAHFWWSEAPPERLQHVYTGSLLMSTTLLAAAIAVEFISRAAVKRAAVKSTSGTTGAHKPGSSLASRRS